MLAARPSKEVLAFSSVLNAGKRLMTNELNKLWCVKYDLIEEGYFQVAESRGIDASH